MRPIQLPRLHSVAIPYIPGQPSPASPAMESPSTDTEYSSSEEDPLNTPLTEDEYLNGSGSSLFRRDYLSGHISYFQQQQLEAAAHKHLAAISPQKSPAAISLPFSRPLTPSPPTSAQSHYSHYSPAPAPAFCTPQIPRVSSHPELGSFRSFEPPRPIAIPTLSLCVDDNDAVSPLDVAMDGDESLSPSTGFPLLGRAYSDRFPVDHELNSYFVETYELEDELGAGGYGFVMTARHRTGGHETAVKFIIKDKVPAHAWVEDESFGRIPSEVMLVSLLEHDNIVRCLDIFEDSHYFYLVQELHGTPWVSRKKAQHQELAVPSLTPSSSCSTLDSLPLLTPHPTDTAIWESQLEQFRNGQKQPENLQPLPPPAFGRRASHDLFECIEQSRHKRLPEPQARYIFAQVIEAVHYLEQLGITHRDIKDENLVIDSDLKVKLIDFGSAVVSDPEQERPYYQMFYGTTAYAASEILQRKKYQAPPAEIWTLGVLLSFLLTGSSPFLSEDDAIHGRVSIRESIATTLSEDCLSLMQRCLEPDPSKRADIYEVRAHPWLQGTLDIECL